MIKALGSGTVISKEAYDRMLTPYGYLWYLEASVGYGCCVKGEPVEEMFMDGNIYGYTCRGGVLLSANGLAFYNSL
ncbi:hypothetical protein [Paenibacillus sp. FSL M7-1046]|uniref:hypothetical protein n=1 Tax=Paenibacillus sp. FSL M7-1046 TaxID=2975315 RepID=UPI0030FBF52D